MLLRRVYSCSTFDKNYSTMENNSNMQTENEEFWKREEKIHRRGKVFGGFLIVTAGSFFLAKELGADIPQWIFTWKMFLIAVGLMIGVKHKFMHPAWLMLILIGGGFLLGDVYPDIAIKPVLWPSLIIILGLFIMFKPRRKHDKWRRMHDKFHRHRFHHYRHRHGAHGNPFDCEMNTAETDTSEDYIDSTTFMAAVKKNVLSKNFKGGDITNVFGGTELNLTQADFTGKATLDLTNVFGGTKLLVPANWEIHSDLVSAFGNIEDKRPVHPSTGGETPKILVLKGTTFMGGIEIKSY
jgi:predicted membrane protein